MVGWSMGGYNDGRILVDCYSVGGDPVGGCPSHGIA